MNYLDDVKKLKHNERFIIPEGDYGKAEIWRLNDIWILFEIPMYGGEPICYNTYTFMGLGVMLYQITKWN